MTEWKNETDRCLAVLKAGGLILYPTDTIWGIGCDATNAAAVQKVYDLKQRSDSKSVIVLLDTEARLDSYVRDIPEAAWQLLEYADKPLTIVYDGARNLAPNVIAPDGSVGIRIIKDEFCRRLIERFRKPIVSTSANISGHPSPGSFTDIDEAIKTGVDYVVNLRQNETGAARPSSVIRLRSNGVVEIIRK